MTKMKLKAGVRRAPEGYYPGRQIAPWNMSELNLVTHDFKRKAVSGTRRLNNSLIEGIYPSERHESDYTLMCILEPVYPIDPRNITYPNSMNKFTLQPLRIQSEKYKNDGEWVPDLYPKITAVTLSGKDDVVSKVDSGKVLISISPRSRGLLQSFEYTIPKEFVSEYFGK